MPRYRLTIEYDGGPFCGWQRQDTGPTVQESLETAAQALCGQAVRVQGSGRTDSGVHAVGQVAHVDLPKAYPAETVKKALNAHLMPQPIAILISEEVPETFHARFSAHERRYLYRILNRTAPPTVSRGRVWWVAKPLDANAMADAALVLQGRHDFSSFRAAHCQAASPVRSLDQLSVETQGEEILIRARARSFLHHQVRNMVGSLALVGHGKWRREDLHRVLQARDRSQAGATAPAHGLYFMAVSYPPEAQWGQRHVVQSGQDQDVIPETDESE